MGKAKTNGMIWEATDTLIIDLSYQYVQLHIAVNTVKTLAAQRIEAAVLLLKKLYIKSIGDAEG